MSMNMRRNTKGVTLLEMMLVLVIASSMIIMMVGFLQQKAKEIRRDKVTLQIQQVLNAGLAYYVAFGQWPTAGVTTLQASGYLPTGTMNNPWGQVISASSTPTGNVFIVTTNLTSTPEAQIIAARFPFGTNVAGVVTVQAPLPGQNLNNARAVNFGSIYHSGGCLPIPICPTGMVPDIFVVPAALSGVYDQPTCADSKEPLSCLNSTGVGRPNVYPVSAFTAFATGPASLNGSSSVGPPSCDGTQQAMGCFAKITAGSTTAAAYSAASAETGPAISSGSYWRVCLSVMTENGLVTPGNPSPAWGQMVGSVMAITRCMPTAGDNPSGSDFTVWSP